MNHNVPDALRYRVLPDGRELCVIVRMFNTILTIGPAGERWFDDQWWFETPEAAVAAFEAWDPTVHPEPAGWFRNPRTGRRRPGGDPGKE